jgi:hypothetical protein
MGKGRMSHTESSQSSSIIEPDGAVRRQVSTPGGRSSPRLVYADVTPGGKIDLLDGSKYSVSPVKTVDRAAELCPGCNGMFHEFQKMEDFVRKLCKLICTVTLLVKTNRY